jgi:hypothetical protein
VIARRASLDGSTTDADRFSGHVLSHLSARIHSSLPGAIRVNHLV